MFQKGFFSKSLGLISDRDSFVLGATIENTCLLAKGSSCLPFELSFASEKSVL